MAISYVRVTEGSIVDTTLTLNIQSSGTDRVFVLGLAYKSNSVLTPTSIVFNGTENFTVERSAADGGDAQCFLYYLIAPTETTADVVITMPAEVRMVGYVALLNGVNQTTPFTANTNEAQGTDNAPTVDVSSAADEMCVDILVQVSAGPDTATATHTEICNGAATGGGTDTRGAGQYVVGQATRTMNWSMSDTDNWNIIAGALQEPSGDVIVNVNQLVSKVVPLTTTILTGTTVSVNQLIAKMVPLSIDVKTGVSTTVNLQTLKVVPYSPTIKTGVTIETNLLTEKVVPYGITVVAEGGVTVEVNLLNTKLVPYSVTVLAESSNDVNHNPIIIDTQMTEAEVTRDIYITGFYWTGVSDGDLCSVKDNCATPKQIWKAEGSANGLDISFKPQQPIPANGIYVDDLDGGILLIYLTSRI